MKNIAYSAFCDRKIVVFWATLYEHLEAIGKRQIYETLISNNINITAARKIRRARAHWVYAKTLPIAQEVR